MNITQTETVTPNQIQLKHIDYLKEAILLHDGLGRKHVKDYEYKVFEMSQPDDTDAIFLNIVVGSKYDENRPYAKIFCRTQRLIRIGDRGGVTLLNAKNKSHSRGMWNAIHRPVISFENQIERISVS